MPHGNAPASDELPEPPAALLALCTGLLPVWSRHLATSRAQSEVAVQQMMQAFADIGPHIHMAERQSEQINDALAQPLGGVSGLVGACEQVLTPLLEDSSVSNASKAAVVQALDMVRAAVGSLEQVARPFQEQTQMVAAQVDRMYMGFQYQDRISQMLVLLEGDIGKLQQVLAASHGPVPGLVDWLAHLESQYAMSEQHNDHRGDAPEARATDQDNETTFF